jgi:hypothetical protein
LVIPGVSYGIRWWRSGRVLRQTARKIGAREGHLLAADAGNGVFGEGPDWRVITTLRVGSAGEVGRALMQRALRAGYELPGDQLVDDGFSCPGTPSLPLLRVTVIPEGLLVAGGGNWFAYRPPWFAFRRGASQVGPVLVWGVADRAGEPAGRVHRPRAIRSFPYSSLARPVVPAGSSAVRLQLVGPSARPPRS